jgi:tetraacyldisaccharide 4'-kinase
MYDYPLPSGNLREFRSGADRADLIIVTKTPKIFSPIVRRVLVKKISPKPNQRIYYSYISYESPLPVKLTRNQETAHDKYSYIILLTGIANNYPIREYLSTQCNELIMMEYADHHRYTESDVKKILNTYHNIISKDKVIFTTEKDAMRLESMEFSNLLEGLPLYYLPIRVKFHHCDESRFDKVILNYVEKNLRNG